MVFEIGILPGIFEFFLPFLLIFAVMYAILLKTKFLTEDPNLNAVISFAIALIVVLSGAGKFIMALAPFLATIFIILFFILIIFLFFGAKLEDVLKSKFIIVLIVSICLIFVFYVAGQMYGTQLYQVNETVTPAGPMTCDFEKIRGTKAFICTIAHPKVLGAIILLGLLAIATFFITYVPKK